MELSAERETHLSMSADDRSVWEIFSDDPVLIRKLESIGAMPVRDAQNGNGRFFRLPANQVTLRRPKKPLSEARKAQLAKQLRAARET